MGKNAAFLQEVSMSHPKLVPFRTEVVASRTELFDRWYAQLQQAEERYGPSWARFAETLQEHRASLLSRANGEDPGRRSRLPESALEYLSTLRSITELTARGPGESAVIRQAPVRVHERRLARRYPIEAAVEYRLMARGAVIGTGRGKTVDISSRGILFEAERTLPPQRIIQLSIDWPVSRDAGGTMELYVAGRTVRRRGRRTALAMERHEFRFRIEQALAAEA
jgi:hypothetical protein